jgi:hypothetical protein
MELARKMAIGFENVNDKDENLSTREGKPGKDIGKE